MKKNYKILKERKDEKNILYPTNFSFKYKISKEFRTLKNSGNINFSLTNEVRTKVQTPANQEVTGNIRQNLKKAKKCVNIIYLITVLVKVLQRNGRIGDR